jgi:hypothetical protein
VSPAVIGLKAIKVGKAIENIDESHGLTPIVAICHSEQKSGDMGFESPSLRHNISSINYGEISSCQN